ncbi:hypothetical protein SB748_08125 [Rhizobium sp. SIMBA_035]|jgi:hypothetical protein
MLVLTIAALAYFLLAIGLVIVIDNMVGFVFPERRPASGRFFDLTKAIAVAQRFGRK